MHTFSKEGPAIFIDTVVAILAFFLGAGWWKFSGREFNQETAMFWARVCGGLCLFGIIMDFVM